MTDTIKISRELLERAATLLQDSLHPPAGCDSFDDWTAQGNALAAELRAQGAAGGAGAGGVASYRSWWAYCDARVSQVGGRRQPLAD